MADDLLGHRRRGRPGVDAPSDPARPIDDELSLVELLQVVHRRRWLLLGCMLLAGLAGMGAIAAITPVYDARALLVIEPDGGRTGATVATPSQTPDSASVDSQVQILASRSLAREVIGQLGLASDTELTGAADGGAGLLGRLLPASLARPKPPDAAPPVDVVGRFLERLAVKREGKSHVIAVAYRSGDPEKAARIANRLAERYMAGQLSRKDAAARRQSGWFDDQLQALKGQLDGAEAALAALSRRQRGASTTPPTAPIRPRSRASMPNSWPPWSRAPGRPRPWAGCGSRSTAAISRPRWASSAARRCSTT